MTETVVIEGVEAPTGDGKPFTIELEDGRKLATWNEEIAAEAMRSDGEVEAVIGSKTSGRFTNYYLNQINGIKDTPKKRTGTPSTSAAPPRDQERIARQWAYGRATELLAASGEEFSFPLSEADFTKLKETAERLLDATR